MKTTQRLLMSLLCAASLSGCWAMYSSEYDFGKGADGELHMRDTPKNWAWITDDIGLFIDSELRNGPAQGQPNWNMFWVGYIQNVEEGWESPQKYVDYIVAARRRAGLPELDFDALRLDGRTWEDMRSRFGVDGVTFASATPDGCVYGAKPDPKEPEPYIFAVITRNHGACKRVFKAPYIAIDTVDASSADRIAKVFFGERRQALVDALDNGGTWPLAEAVRTQTLGSSAVFNAQGNTPRWITGTGGLSYEIAFNDFEHLAFRASSWQ